MSNILVRTIWGALFVAIVLSSFIIGGYVAAFVLAVFMSLGLLEFYRFFDHIEEINSMKSIGLAGALILFCGAILSKTLDFNLTLLFIPVLFSPFLLIIFSKSKNPLTDVSILLFSWVYLLFPFYFMYEIYAFNHEKAYQWIYIVGFFLMVWANDTFAYLSGRFFGKNKLFERISPKKTWEGAIGGFIFTLLFGAGYALVINDNIMFWIISALVISPTSILGDLIESRLKRIVDVKDSGTILPGHGGVLDRFDAAMFAAPFFYFLLILFLS